MTITMQTIQETQDEIVDDFALFTDWTEKYRYIIELGRKVPELPSEYKTDTHIVRGCQSQVWLHASLKDGLVILQADSDAMIVRGLIALMLRVYSDHTPDEILAAQPEFIDRIGMSQHLTPGRSNGLHSMIKQVKLYAAAYKKMESQA